MKTEEGMEKDDPTVEKNTEKSNENEKKIKH